MAEAVEHGVSLARIAASRKHHLLATTALVGALFVTMAPASADPDDCTTGATSTCTGDQSEGIASGDDFPSSSTTLNVFGLTKNITPASGTNGIFFSGDTSVEINSKLGFKSINVSGVADGILATAPGNVTVNHQGAINGGKNGINAYSTGANVAVDAFGNISNTSANAINAYAPNGGIEIDYFGNIDNAGDRGISAYGKGDIEIDHFGKISSSGQGVYARSEAGSVDIDSWGSITSTDSDGVRAEAQTGGKTIEISRFGNVNAADHGIIALAGGDASVKSIGNVKAGIDGINVQSSGGSASIESWGDVTAQNQGIFAHGNKGASIQSFGDVTTETNDAIFAYNDFSGSGDATVVSVGDVKAGNRGIVAITGATNGTASIVSKGKVTAKGAGVDAYSANGAASVKQVGDVTSTDSSGIRAGANGADATIFSRGKVQAQTEGVAAHVTGNGNASVDHKGDVSVEDGNGITAVVTGDGNASVMSNGKVVAPTMGVAAVVSGKGNASIDHTGDVTAIDKSNADPDKWGGTGIRAYVGTGNATITSKGNVHAYNEAIAGIVQTKGDVSITHVGNATSDNARGVSGETNDGNVTINVTGDVKSKTAGIYARTDGTDDAVKVNSKGNITTTEGAGIYADALNFSGSSTVDVVSQGNINAGGGNMGIHAIADGNVSVNSKGNVTALNGDKGGSDGINAYSFAGAAKVTSVGDIKAANQGIFAKGSTGAEINSKGNVLAQDNDGIFAITSTGDAKVVSVGDVSAVGRDKGSDPHSGGRGIAAFTPNGNASIDSEGKVSAYVDGVYALATGGNASVRQIGDVSSTKANGIQAISRGVGTFNASVESKGNVTASVNGVLAYREGDGNASIKHQGDVTVTGGFGMVAQVYGDGNASITDSKGNVTAQTQGVAAIVKGKGDATINHEGDVTSRGADGISATVDGSGNATIVSKGKVQAQTSGVYAAVGAGSGGGDGNASVTHDGDVTSTGTFGIRADVNGKGNATIDSSGNVKARMDGVTANVQGDGNASVTHDGNVTSEQSTGIAAFANGNGDATVDSSGVVDSRWVGVSAVVNGNGNASVTHDGNVTSKDVEGIMAVAKGTGNATIDSSGNVQAKSTGIQANANIGNASITHVGKVTSSNARGVSAESTTGNVTIDVAGDVNSKLGGIHGLTTGTDDAVKITSKGDITTTEGIGIYGQAMSGTSTVTIKSTGDVNAGGGNMGIQAIARGNASVESKGNVTAWNGGGNGNDGINVQSQIGTASVTSAGNVKAANAGIFAQGATGASIDSKGDVFAQDNDGIFAYATGSGDATVKSRGDIDASGRTTPSTGGRGIFAMSGGTGTASIDSEGDVKSQVQGVFAYASTGSATVRQIGDVTSDASNGIEAYSWGAGDYQASIESKGDVTADVNGITAFRSGDGTASIKHEGDVTGTKGHGIVATLYYGEGDATIVSKGKVHAKTQGVSAVVIGDGNASVTHDGDVVSDTAFGIRAEVLQSSVGTGNGNATVDSSGNVTAKQHGVSAYVQHSGDASVTHDGNVKSTDSVGVLAETGSVTGDKGNATVNTKGNIQAQQEGILARANDGNVKVTHVGDVKSSDTYGVNALAFGNSNSVTVDTSGNVSGKLEGIQAIAFGTNSSVSVKAAGSVTSDKIAGIRAQALGTGGTASIDSTANVTALTDGLVAQADEAVSVKQSGDVSVTYNNAIFAQSMNGTVDVWAGGGNVAGNENGVFALGSDDVNVTVTSGKVSANVFRGVFAQSDNGDVNVDVDGGWVVANGDNGDSDGVFVNAANGKGSVTVAKGARVTGGSNKDASFGVEFGTADGGNTLTNYGLIDDANKGKTIGGSGSDDVVYNYGVVDGDFYLGGGTNRFDNEDGGWMYFKTFSSVGAGNDFNNTGSVTPWGEWTVGSSVLEGNYNQSGTGRFVTDIDLAAGDSDYLDVTGNVAAGGTVVAHVTDIGTSTSPYSATIIHSNGTTTDNGITGTDQGALQVNVTTTSSTVDINVAIDFGGFGQLEGNQERLGEYFQSLFEDTVPGGLNGDQEAFYLSLINIGTMADYRDGLDQLSPESANAPIIGTLYGAETFASNLFSCRPIDGAYRYISETTCVWTAVSGAWSDHDGGSGDLDLSDKAVSVAGGGQYAIDANWTVGLGFGYERGESESRWTEFDRDLFSAGIVAKAQFDSWMFGAALTGGWGNVDSERHLTIPVVATAKGDRDIRYAAVTGRAAYLMQMDNFYLKPMLEGAATFVSADGYQETGAGVANLKVEDTDEFVGRGTLSVELGTEFGSPDKVVVRPFVNGGVTFLTNSDIDVEAGFPGLGDGTVTLTTHLDNVYANVGVGVDVLAVNGLTGRIEYNGRFSSNEEQHRGTAKLSLRF